jgi:hypothetical protein
MEASNRVSGRSSAGKGKRSFLSTWKPCAGEKKRQYQFLIRTMNVQSFSREDLDQVREKGISPEQIDLQLTNFRKGFPPISLVAPATVGDGIIRLSDEQAETHAQQYRELQQGMGIIKFVPASGAASRMFKSLFEYLGLSGQDDAGSNAGGPTPDIVELIDRIHDLALWDDLEAAIRKNGLNPDELVSGRKYGEIVRMIVGSGGLDYGQLPKGLIPFHRYAEECRTPLEEHMVEGVGYAQGNVKNVHLHFTVSPEHMEGFRSLFQEKKAIYEKRYGVTYSAEFSVQHPATDVIAADPANQPFRDADGRLLFRPGGHGALLANLDELDADLIFIKNIDNVCPDRMKPVTRLYKQALAGILLETRDQVFRYAGMLESGDHSALEEIENYLRKRLNTRLSDADRDLRGRDRAAVIEKMLKRPIRVCGMVRNEGEPGGGPFWCRNRDGSVSLQIVEPAQINFQDPEQAGIAGKASHFNPVDLVCSTRDHTDKKHDLRAFVDPDTGLISSKSFDGRSLKAQELPGLWNGSMSDWNTLFVEVPIETFNPVKTINDLLRPEHQA